MQLGLAGRAGVRGAARLAQGTRQALEQGARGERDQGADAGEVEGGGQRGQHGLVLERGHLHGDLAGQAEHEDAGTAQPEEDQRRTRAQQDHGRHRRRHQVIQADRAGMQGAAAIVPITSTTDSREEKIRARHCAMSSRLGMRPMCGSPGTLPLGLPIVDVVQYIKCEADSCHQI
jgi:hypothetical protein